MNLVSLKLWQFLNKLGVDRPIFFTILARGWGAGAGLLTIFFLAKFISPEEQGYYYTFNSIIALQVFAELGLNYAIVQFASHEMAHLTWSTDGRLLGDPKSKRRLQSLVHFTLIWFSVAGLLLIAILLPLGLYFFGVISSQNSSDMAIAAPWIFVVVFASINLIITAAVAVLEGCGKVEEMAILRLAQTISSSVLVWTVLSLGGHLYALVANSLIVTLLGIVWLWGNYKTFFKDLLVHRSELTGMNWRNEIWPFQWRIAISWMSGYLSFQIFNPLLFATYGPVVAGRMGMSLQIVGAMNGLAITWITTKTPTYGKLIAQKELKKLDSLFNRGLKQSFLTLFAGVSLGLTLLWYLETFVPRYSERILPFNLMTCLCIAALANHVSGAQGAYLRSYKKDPLMPLSVISGVAISILSAISIPRYGADGAVISYLFVVLVIGLIFGTLIFVKKRYEYSHE
ncbi:lipopolysaccharide biosynthesis protein [Limnohabitans sp. JirII-31]|uniref:lipopolysaccharide biosynthesis protein n=1 Tax=Limnohabitans sp. JirII-31 TaxID=1977908 RepID=UPI0013043983|nr:hypothetical protein [Limnohabitans sp. JirII-31]